MPRQMPPYAAWFQQRVDEAIRIARAGDLVIASNPVGTPLRREWHFSRVELLYELAYLRIFLEWETYLQETFVRYLCGYRSARGMCAPIAGTQYRADLSSAESDVLRGRFETRRSRPSSVSLGPPRRRKTGIKSSPNAVKTPPQPFDHEFRNRL